MNRVRQPVIGITVYNAEDSNYYYPEDYVSAIKQAGGAPYILPPQMSDFNKTIKSLDGVVLTGGGDINPTKYGGESHGSLYWINNAQDEAELKIAQITLQFEKPLLATCRGMQIINTMFGGTLHPHLPDIYGENILHRLSDDKPIDHEITLVAESRLANLLGTVSFSVKSWHHQSIAELATGFQAVGIAEDGVIEAIESKDYPDLIAVQWHPEIEHQNDPVQQQLFKKWLQLCTVAE